MKTIGKAMLLFALTGLLSACNDKLEMQQEYDFSVTALPVPKKVAQGETVEIRCQLVRSGRYEGAAYCLRYFQPDGKGTLSLDDGTVFLPNDLYPLERETFWLYYTSASEDQQTIDLYFFDNRDREFDLSFTFNNLKEEEETAMNLF